MNCFYSRKGYSQHLILQYVGSTKHLPVGYLKLIPKTRSNKKITQYHKLLASVEKQGKGQRLRKGCNPSCLVEGWVLRQEELQIQGLTGLRISTKPA